MREGHSFRLNCGVDNFYEYCLFRHNENICDFAWKTDDWNITITNCEDYEDRMEWSGDYDNHKCAITIKNAKLEDSGSWSCEIESYIAGKFRGYGHNATAEMEIKVIPRIIESDTDKETESGNIQLISKYIPFHQLPKECGTDWTWTIWEKGEEQENGYFTLAVYQVHLYTLNWVFAPIREKFFHLRVRSRIRNGFCHKNS